MKNARENMIRAAIILSLFAFIGTAVLSFTHETTKDRIARNERDELLRSLHNIIKPDMHDNDIFNETIQVRDSELLGTDEPVKVYIARKDSKPVAAVFASIAPNGYNGRIKLLVGVNLDAKLTGVRVISHMETPGLGDAIEEQRSDWILGFTGKSLQNPTENQWKVKKDGGYFDQFTGATITPRAIVKAVYNTLLYFRAHKQTLFAKSGKVTNE
jgi:electron transport complex protein RnfG